MGNPDGPYTCGPLRHRVIKKDVLDHGPSTSVEHMFRVNHVEIVVRKVAVSQLRLVAIARKLRVVVSC